MNDQNDLQRSILSAIQSPCECSCVSETTYRLSRDLFVHSPSSIIIYQVQNDGAYAADYIIMEVNDACLQTEGWDRSVIGKRLSEVRPEADRFGIVRAFQQAYLTGEPTLFPAWIYREGDRESWFENRIFRLPDGQIVAMYLDITEAKIREQRIKYMGSHDTLTGLLNRSAFEKRLSELTQGDRSPYTMITGDLDGLKLVNDALGHLAGDSVLKWAADAFRHACRDTDILCRWGGDEFIALLPDTAEGAGLEISNRIQEMFDKGVAAAAGVSSVNLSLGCAGWAQQDKNWRQTLKRAENRMNKSKFLSKKSYRSVILSSIRNTLLEKSYETEEHGERMAQYCRAMGEILRMPTNMLDELEVLGMLHDIGKIAIDNQILMKPSELTREEFEKIKEHPETGYRIASTIPELVGVADYIRAHHERWDGSGYPAGLAAEEIPLSARIMAVADAYDAMTSNRPYRQAMTDDAAREELRANAGSQFDPAIVTIFLKYLEEQ